MNLKCFQSKPPNLTHQQDSQIKFAPSYMSVSICIINHTSAPHL